MAGGAEACVGENTDGHVAQAVTGDVTLAVDLLEQVAAGFEFGTQPVRGGLRQVELVIDLGGAQWLW